MTNLETRNKEYFLSLTDEIVCNSCGICCSSECSHLIEKTCDIHPFQSEYSIKHSACELKPMELVLFFSIFCPPALKAIYDKTGVEILCSQEDSRYCDKNQLNEGLFVELSF